MMKSDIKLEQYGTIGQSIIEFVDRFIIAG